MMSRPGPSPTWSPACSTDPTFAATSVTVGRHRFGARLNARRELSPRTCCADAMIRPRSSSAARRCTSPAASATRELSRQVASLSAASAPPGVRAGRPRGRLHAQHAPRPSRPCWPPRASAPSGRPARPTSASRASSTASAIAPKVLFTADGYLYNGKRCDAREGAEIFERADRPHPRPSSWCRCSKTRRTLHGLPGAHATPIRGWPRRRKCVRAAALRPPAVHHVFLRYHGRAQVHRAVAGGVLLNQKEHRLQVRPEADDVHLLLHHLRLDDVELARVGAGRSVPRCCSSTARRSIPMATALMRLQSTRKDQHLRHQRQVHRRPREGGRQAGATSTCRTPQGTILSTGSPLSDESFDYVYRDFKEDVCLSSISPAARTSTAASSAATPWGRSIAARSRRGPRHGVRPGTRPGNPVVGETGELVCAKAFPSMPIGFWGDDDGSSATAPPTSSASPASGITATSSRSRARRRALSRPLRRHAQSRRRAHRHRRIYRQVEPLDEVEDSLVIGQEWDDDVRVILFVKMAKASDDDELAQRIRKQHPDELHTHATCRPDHPRSPTSRTPSA
jgi:acetoacetyl-CoA synthetase